MEDEDFHELKKTTKSKIEKLESNVNELANTNEEIRELVNSNLKKVANIAQRYETAEIEEKRIIISSMFPEFFGV